MCQVNTCIAWQLNYITTEPLKGHGDEKKKMRWEEKLYINDFAFFRKCWVFWERAQSFSGEMQKI